MLLIPVLWENSAVVTRLTTMTIIGDDYNNVDDGGKVVDCDDGEYLNNSKTAQTYFAFSLVITAITDSFGQARRILNILIKHHAPSTTPRGIHKSKT